MSEKKYNVIVPSEMYNDVFCCNGCRDDISGLTLVEVDDGLFWLSSVIHYGEYRRKDMCISDKVYISCDEIDKVELKVLNL